MLDRHDERTITAKTQTVLDTLRKNLDEHAEIVKEARAGYMHRAESALTARLAELKSGKLVELTFKLSPPQDHSSAYRTIIKMLELHLEAGKETIELKAADVSQYVLNDWGWMDGFLVGNAAYSEKSMALAQSRGIL